LVRLMNKKTDSRANADGLAGGPKPFAKPFDSKEAPLPRDPALPLGEAGSDPDARFTLPSPPSLSPAFPDIVPYPGPTADRDGVRRRVLMLGLRGVPDIQGGVEKHVEMLAQELVLRGWDVEVVGRSKYLSKSGMTAWRGVRITSLWAPASMSLETIFHTFIGVIYAAFKRPEIVHIHAVGPGLFAPLARLLGLRVVVTHHGYDYDREKWGGFAKSMLKFGERLAMQFSNGSIAVSREVTDTMHNRYGSNVAHIPNGVTVRPAPIAGPLLERFGLRRRRYIVLVARFVPEKRQLDLIQAYARLGQTEWKLALIGGADHRDTGYAKQVETMAAKTDGVVLTGFQSGDDLATLFSQAGLFVLPSSHEGMPIALLEALGYGLPVLASDIPANHEVDLPSDDYFPTGDIDALAAGLRRKMDAPYEPERALNRIRTIEQTYAWPSISRDTIDVYRQAMKPPKGRSKP
jgi:glycosyltransferase involved in cell wall biosynthesis